MAVCVGAGMSTSPSFALSARYIWKVRRLTARQYQ